MLRAVLARGDVQRREGPDQRDGQIPVDVRVHAREGELDRRDGLAGARLEKGCPGVRRGRRVRFERAQGREVEIGEDDVQVRQEERVSEGGLPHARQHALGHLEIQLVEAGDPVRGRQGLIDGLHPRHHLLDAIHRCLRQDGGEHAHAPDDIKLAGRCSFMRP